MGEQTDPQTGTYLHAQTRTAQAALSQKAAFPV